MTIKELRASINMTQQEFSDYFNIPKRTIENWEGEKRTPASYILELIEYKIKKEKANMKKEQLQNKIETMIDKKMLETGKMGTETVSIELKLTDEEKEIFYDIEEYENENYWWEFVDGNNLRISYVEENKEETEMKNEWLEKTLEGLKVGDLVAKNFGSFKKSMAYVVTEITDDKVICRLLRNSYSIEKIKMNKNYCSRDLIFELDKLGSFPAIIKLNLGYKDTDEEREKNLNNVWA